MYYINVLNDVYLLPTWTSYRAIHDASLGGLNLMPGILRQRIASFAGTNIILIHEVDRNKMDKHLAE